MSTPVDEMDLRLLGEVLARPRVGMREYARELDVARGTVQTRLARLERLGVIRDYAPSLAPARLGLPVLAFVHLHLAQGQLSRVTRALLVINEVLEAHSIAGEGDVLCRVVARDTDHLESVIQRLLQLPGVVRTRSEVALSERIASRSASLLNLVHDHLSHA